MLRLSSDSLAISFSPDGFKLEKQQGFVRAKTVDATLVRTRPGAGSPPWQACLQALQTTLGEERWWGAPIHVTLSDRLVRYLLVPDLTSLSTPQERLAYAQFQFRETYGNQAEQWEIRVDNAFPNSSAIACGMDKALCGELLGLGQFSKGQVLSVAPRFVSTLNRVLKKLRMISDQRYVISLYEAGGITAGLVDGGQWRSIRQRFITSSATASLCDILEQERLNLAVNHETTRVLLLNWPALTEADVSKIDPRWQLQRHDLSEPLPDLESQP